MTTEAKMAKRDEGRLVTPMRPYDRFSRWEHEMERMFSDFWKYPLLGRWNPEYGRTGRPVLATMPAVDVYEEKDDVVVKAELPGFSKEDIEVTLGGSTLTIRGEKKKEEELKEEDYFFSERSYGTFVRNIDLPAGVKADQVKAVFKDGILGVRLPKTEEAKRKMTTIKIA